MIKIFDTILKWTLYPIMFGIVFGIYYIGTAIFFFKLPECDIKDEFKFDYWHHKTMIGELSYVLSWMLIGVILLIFIMSKLMPY